MFVADRSIVDRAMESLYEYLLRCFNLTELEERVRI